MPTLKLYAENETPINSIDYDIEFSTWENDKLMLFIKKVRSIDHEYSFRFYKLEIIFLRDFLNTLIENT